MRIVVAVVVVVVVVDAIGNWIFVMLLVSFNFFLLLPSSASVLWAVMTAKSLAERNGEQFREWMAERGRVNKKKTNYCIHKNAFVLHRVHSSLFFVCLCRWCLVNIRWGSQKILIYFGAKMFFVRLLLMMTTHFDIEFLGFGSLSVALTIVRRRWGSFMLAWASEWERKVNHCTRKENILIWRLSPQLESVLVNENRNFGLPQAVLCNGQHTLFGLDLFFLVLQKHELCALSMRWTKRRKIRMKFNSQTLRLHSQTSKQRQTDGGREGVTVWVRNGLHNLWHFQMWFTLNRE